MKHKNPLPRFDSRDFAQQFHYAGRDLGVRYAPASTAFRVWAPTAQSVDLLLFQTGHRAETPRVVPMTRAAKGTWTATVNETCATATTATASSIPGSPPPSKPSIPTPSPPAPTASAP